MLLRFIALFFAIINISLLPEFTLIALTLSQTKILQQRSNEAMIALAI
jgi:hypothetical protein